MQKTLKHITKINEKCKRKKPSKTEAKSILFCKNHPKPKEKQWKMKKHCKNLIKINEKIISPESKAKKIQKNTKMLEKINGFGIFSPKT